MKFNLPLDKVQLGELIGKLLPLTTSATYVGETLNIEPVKADKPEDNQEIEAKITDIVIPYIEIVNDLPDWGEIARRAEREKRTAATREHDALAAIARRRRPQEAT